MNENTNIEQFALDFLSDMSVTPDLAMHYRERLSEWTRDGTNDDDIRTWFAELGYPLANPDLTDASEQFRDTLPYWNGVYTVAFAGRFVPLVISDERVTINGRAIGDYQFASDRLTWKGGDLMFSLASAAERPALVGKLVRGRLAIDGGLPDAENAAGVTVIIASQGDAGASNLRDDRFTDLDFFNGRYTILPISHGPAVRADLTVALSGNTGRIGFDDLGPQTDYGHFHEAPQAGQNGKWNGNALIFHDAGNGLYGKIQFVVGALKDPGGKVGVVKGFVGSIGADASAIDVPNVMGVLRPPEKLRVKKAAQDPIEVNTYDATIASTVFTGIALFFAVGVFIWQEIRADRDGKVDKRHADEVEAELKALKTQLTEINSKIPEIPYVDVDGVKQEIVEHHAEIAKLQEQIEGNLASEKKLSEKIEELSKEIRNAGSPGEALRLDAERKRNIDARERSELDRERYEWDKRDAVDKVDALRETVKHQRIREAREHYKINR
jgi:hypothetical protein